MSHLIYPPVGVGFPPNWLESANTAKIYISIIRVTQEIQLGQELGYQTDT